jgi:hypothetical protein
MWRKRRIQRAILLREGDYCCDQAQFAASSPTRGDSSQELFGFWAASHQQRHPECCEREQGDGKQGEQA